ncbi:dihydrofolate reductase family protein (plasmid) [Streptomyces althioticus]|uniref:dihydrofolate reductase family protein n=1 Tax=Streptomyces althioticus TaxID=83380 RepID=UPI002F90AFA1|nr:dihydrofolate reductase family protein [Streptomyces althioticus]
MRRLLPDPMQAPADPRARARWLAQEYAVPEGLWVRANMISSLDGASSVAGRSGGLGSRADEALFAITRALADVIVVGAQTARSEFYGPAEPHPYLADARVALGRPAAATMAVISARLDISPALLEQPAVPGSDTVVITTRSAPADARRRVEEHGIEVIEAGENVVNPSQLVDVVKGKGFESVLLEGGPNLLGQFHHARILNEICLTISPRIVGGESSRILLSDEDVRDLRLVSLLEDEGFLFTRYQHQSSS